MGLSYQRLWKLLIDKGIKKKELCKAASISTSSLSKLNRNENVRTDVLNRICEALHCDISEIVEYIPENKKGINKGKTGVNNNETYY